MNERFWGEMLGVLKDIGSYMEKQDATQVRAKISVPPGMQENPKPIKGGEMPSGFAPTSGVAKSYVLADDGKINRHTAEICGVGETFTKEDEVEEEVEEEETVEEEDFDEDEEFEEEEEEVEDTEEDYDHEEDDEEELDELKSLLKDIRSALVNKSNSVDTVKSELKKALPSIVKGETDKMLRKMGFIPTRGDIKPLDVEKSYGLDETEETVATKDIKKSTSKESLMQDALDNMSKKSWAELGQLREKTDGFNAFGSK